MSITKNLLTRGASYKSRCGALLTGRANYFNVGTVTDRTGTWQETEEKHQKKSIKRMVEEIHALDSASVQGRNASERLRNACHELVQQPLDEGELGRLAMGTYCAASRCKIASGNWQILKLVRDAGAGWALNRRDAIWVESPANTWKSSANLAVIIALATGVAGIGGDAARHAALADEIAGINARVVAVGIPGASALAQVGTFRNVAPPNACANPIPTKFPSYILAGAVLDPKRILIGSSSNFGAPLAIGAGQEGAFLSIDPSGSHVLRVPPDFAQSGDQASALGGAVQMFSANSPHWYNGVKNPVANTALYTGVSNPLGLSNNNAFGRIWPANAPFGLDGVGSSSILDPTGLPLAGPPNPAIGGVYVGSLTNRNVVTTPTQPQVIPGSLSKGAVGTALLGPSPDGTCKAVFAVVTADGAIVQEHTLKGLDGIAPAGTIRPLIRPSENAVWNASFGPGILEPRLGVLMNPYTTTTGVVRQLFVSEPFTNTIAVVDLVIIGAASNQVFGLGAMHRISSDSLSFPVDLAAVQRDALDVRWASNSTLDDGSDFYVANRGNNSIVRMRQDGSVVAIRNVTLDNLPIDDVQLNGITTSTDGTTIYVTFADPYGKQGGVLALPAF
jgi:hypothetical protein